MNLGLTGKIAIVTGGGSGIGRGIALALAEEGVNTIIADIDAERASTVVNEIEKKYGKGRALDVKTDVSNRKSVDLMVRQAVDKFGTVHILVNNAGVTIPNFIEDVTEEDIEKTVKVNIKGVIYCIRAVQPYMKKQRWGRIINVSSTSGVKGSAGLSVYSMSKFAIRGLTQALGLELGKFGITVNAVAPSDVYEAGSWSENSSLYEISMKKEDARTPEELRRKRIEKIPLRRSCTIEDVADIIVFLVSERAGFINAQTIQVNGGLLPS